MQTFTGNTLLKLTIDGIQLEGALLRASLGNGEVLIPSALRSNDYDLYWHHVRIDYPFSLDARAIRSSNLSESPYSQQLLEIKWKLSRKAINQIASTEAESVYESLSIPQEATEIIIDSNTLINEKVALYLARHPELVHELSPRAFEELVAHVLSCLGLQVELTQASRDGGVDIYAYVKTQVASFLMVVECKKWRPDRPIGIDIVQRLFGVQQGLSANKSIIVTTSHFTEPAMNQCKQYRGLMELKDFENLKGWLAESTRPNLAVQGTLRDKAAQHP